MPYPSRRPQASARPRSRILLAVLKNGRGRFRVFLCYEDLRGGRASRHYEQNYASFFPGGPVIDIRANDMDALLRRVQAVHADIASRGSRCVPGFRRVDGRLRPVRVRFFPDETEFPFVAEYVPDDGHEDVWVVWNEEGFALA